MCYSGDAFLTLKTRVQVCSTANTYHLSASNFFLSPLILKCAGIGKLCRARIRVSPPRYNRQLICKQHRRTP
jgi:hypothetical protein